MSVVLDTQKIVSIYDLMVERRRKLKAASQMEDISTEAHIVPRLKVEKDAVANTKTWPRKLELLPKRSVPQMPSLMTLKSDSYRGPSTVTASHLTRNLTYVKLQPPAKREVINKLVEKMSMIGGRPKAESVDPPQPSVKPPKSKQVSGTQRKKTPGTSQKKQISKSNFDLTYQRPLSPRKSVRTPKEKKVDPVPKKKTTPKSAPKLKSARTRVLQMSSARESDLYGKMTPLSSARWRV